MRLEPTMKPWLRAESVGVIGGFKGKEREKGWRYIVIVILIGYGSPETQNNYLCHDKAIDDCSQRFRLVTFLNHFRALQDIRVTVERELQGIYKYGLTQTPAIH